jgi:hypothetical protein
MGLSSFVKRFDKRKPHGPSAPEAAEEKTPTVPEREESDQTAEEACWRRSPSEPPLILIADGWRAAASSTGGAATLAACPKT